MTTHWRYSRASALACLEIAHCRATRRFAQRGHFHDQAQIVAVFEGWRAFATPVGTFRAEAGQIVVLPSRLFHAPLMPARSAVSNLYLDPEHPAVHGREMPIVLDGCGAVQLVDVIERVAALPMRSTEVEPDPDISRLARRVAGSGTSIEAIAEHEGYSVDGFIRRFLRQFGTTPAQYRIAHRLNVARSLLRQGAAPAEAASESGFADQSHLGRHFLRAYGTTPAAYRAGMWLP